MSLSKIRPFFESVAKDLGFKIVTEAFSSESLSTMSGPQAFIDLQPTTSTRRQNHAEHLTPVSIDLFIGKGRSTTDLEAKSYDVAQKFIEAAFKKQLGTPIARVLCRSREPRPINQSNDNAVLIHLEFEATVLSGIKGS